MSSDGTVDARHRDDVEKSNGRNISDTKAQKQFCRLDRKTDKTTVRYEMFECHVVFLNNNQTTD